MTMTRRRLLDDTFKKSVVGNPAIATDSLARMYPGIVMQGWTEQDGTPTPEAPVPIVSAGTQNQDSGKWEYEVEVLGGNFWSKDQNAEFIESKNFSFNTPIPEGEYIFSSIVHSTDTDKNQNLISINMENGKTLYYNIDRSEDNERVDVAVKIISPCVSIRLYASTNFGFSTGDTALFSDIMINLGNTALPYEPYKTPQTVTLQSDRQLTKWDRLEKRGGQWGWVYKHVLYDDFSELNIAQDQISGVNRFGIHDYASKGVVIQSGSGIEGIKKIMVSNLYRPIHNQMDAPGIAGSTTKPRLWVMDDSISSVEEFRQKASELGLVIYAETAEETFVPLSTSEQEQMNNLYTYRPTTVLSNQQDCEMALTYKSRKGMS